MEESGSNDGRVKEAGINTSSTTPHAYEKYWFVHPNGGRQLIDPREFDLERLAAQATQVGGRLVVESETMIFQSDEDILTTLDGFRPETQPRRFEPPISSLGPLFRSRLAKVYSCLADYEVEINTRSTTRILGGYYKTRRLVRIYSHDGELGRRPLEELFDTFLHEMAHHIEYTEPDSFHARECERVYGRMHSGLFWRILGELKGRWADLQLAR